MPPPAPKLPRRHEQRKALRGRNEAPPCDQESQEQRRAYEPRIRRNQKSGYNWDNDSASDSDLEQDSGYNSHSDSEAKAEYYKQMMDEFEEMGPTISNLGNVALNMIKTEERKWQM
jgi:hypothetical protein